MIGEHNTAVMTKIVETYEFDEEGTKILTKTTETYEVEFQTDVDEMLEDAKDSKEYNLVGHTLKYKPAKYKKEELVRDEYWILTLKKEF